MKLLYVLKDAGIDKEHKISCCFHSLYQKLHGSLLNCVTLWKRAIALNIFIKLWFWNLSMFWRMQELVKNTRFYVASIKNVKNLYNSLLNCVQLRKKAFDRNIYIILWWDLSMYWRTQGSMKNTMFPVVFIKYIKKTIQQFLELCSIINASFCL